MEDLRRVSKWHGRVVDPKLARTTALELVTAMQARRKKAAKRLQVAKARHNLTRHCMQCMVASVLRYRNQNTPVHVLRSVLAY